MPFLDHCLIMEEMIRYDNRIGIALSLGSIPAKPLLRFGTEEQKKKYLQQAKFWGDYDWEINSLM